MPNFRPARRLLGVLFICLTLLPGAQVRAQDAALRKAIDLMLVIDNSCSMFPESYSGPGCTAMGNDPNFLRITGADLFLARLGFADPNEADFQVGIVSLGTRPSLTVPLQPLLVAGSESASNPRDRIAAQLANPQPAGGTDLFAALELAYRQLRESPNARPNNLPAIVLITDGVPFPNAADSAARLEKLVSDNTDIPLFLMLLQNGDDVSPDYRTYIRAWQDIEARNTHVVTYEIENAAQIEETYNQIIAQLQNTIPSPGFPVGPDTPRDVPVGKCVRKMIVTIIHPPDAPRGNVVVTDPDGRALREGDPGVKLFRGDANPIETISIAALTPAETLKEGFWTITSDQLVRVFLDRQGCYEVRFVAPETILTDVPNVFRAAQRHPAARDLTISFRLQDQAGEVVHDLQPIQGEVELPDGGKAALRISSDIAPDADGVYSFSYSFTTDYGRPISDVTRFGFVLNAGLVDDTTGTRVPITSARLLVDVWRGPYIADITPAPFVCAPATASELRVTIGDLALAQPGSLEVRAFAAGQETRLSAAADQFSGDVSALCTALLAAAPCSAEADGTMMVRLAGRLTNGDLLPATQQQLAVRLVAPTCTATPPPPPTETPLPPPTPTPSPTPIPDTDADGCTDDVDRCPDSPQWRWLPLFGCCPPQWYHLVLLGALAFTLLAFSVFWFVPWLRVLLSPPPTAFVKVERKGEKLPYDPVNTYLKGMLRRHSKVTIGGDKRRADIVVTGLKSLEFIVEQNGEQIRLFEYAPRKLVCIITDQAQTVSTSERDITLKVSIDPKKL